MANEIMNMPTMGSSIAGYVSNEAVRESIRKVLPEKSSEMFFPSIISAVQATPALKECTCQSIISAGVMGASLQLPPSPQLGYFHLVPYKTKKNISGKWVDIKEAQFILGYKGYVQLAIRTGQYKNIICNDVKDGEIEYNPITEEITLHPILNPAEREKAPVVGYFASFELVSGFKKQMFCSTEEMKAHAKKYSIAYRYDLNSGKKSSPWTTNFDAMAKKTMIRMLLSKWGIMSVEMIHAYVNDMSVIDEDGTARYVDNQNTIEEQVHEDIAANANSRAFEESEVIDAEVVEASVAPTVEAPRPQPDKPRRGRPPKAQANTEPEKPAMPEPEPQTVTVEEAEVSFAPEWE